MYKTTPIYFDVNVYIFSKCPPTKKPFFKKKFHINNNIFHGILKLLYYFVLKSTGNFTESVRGGVILSI